MVILPGIPEFLHFFVVPFTSLLTYEQLFGTHAPLFTQYYVFTILKKTFEGYRTNGGLNRSGPGNYEIREGSKVRWMYTVLLFVAVLFSLAACQGDDPGSQSPEKEDENSSETSEESNIEGELWKGDGDLAVVLSHGAVYNAESWDDQGKKLADNGITAFATEDTSPRTLKKAAAMLKEEHGAEEVALMGASAGGSSAIEAVTEGDFDFQKVVLLSPGGDPMKISDTPVLTVYSEEEGYRELEENAGESMETMEISGGAHAQEIFKGEKSEEVISKIIQFLKEENTS